METRKRATADVVMHFLNAETVPGFGPPGTIMSDNGSRFTVGIVETFPKDQITVWRTVFVFALMSNGRADRVVGTMKQGKQNIMNKTGQS